MGLTVIAGAMYRVIPDVLGIAHVQVTVPKTIVKPLLISHTN